MTVTKVVKLAEMVKAPPKPNGSRIAHHLMSLSMAGLTKRKAREFNSRA